MRLSNRFLNLVQQQLSSFDAEPGLEYLVVYVAKAKDGESPGLQAIGQWPKKNNSLPPVESDGALRSPSPHRRWYPLQDGSILMGVLRAEKSQSDQAWPDALDTRLHESAALLSQCLALELERSKLFEELNQQKEQISLMVHQLRNPLAALRTYAQLLLRKLEPESSQRPLVEGLLSEQSQLNKYISALDQLSHAQLPPQSVSPAPLLLPPVLPKTSLISVKSLLNPLIERAAATSNLQGRQWFGPIDWPKWALKERPAGDGIVAEIVANLLDNAFRYSSKDSSIGLLVKEEGLCVWDSGDPIAEEEREGIFEKGFRGSNSVNRPGSGLGLALARQLSEQMGWQIQLIISPDEFDKSLPKTGNAFVLNLPRKSLPKEAL